MLKILTKRIVGVSGALDCRTLKHAHAHTHRKRGMARVDWKGWMVTLTQKEINEANKAPSVLVSGGSGTRRRRREVMAQRGSFNSV